MFVLDEIRTVQANFRGTNHEFKIVPYYIGSGSYASVHKYKDEYYNRWFAIKRANKDLTEEECQRFKAEFDTMQKLNSPYVVEVYNFDETNRQYVMEYVDKTLEAYIVIANIYRPTVDGVCCQRTVGCDDHRM